MAKITLQGYRCEHCGHEWVKGSATEGDTVNYPSVRVNQIKHNFIPFPS